MRLYRGNERGEIHPDRSRMSLCSRKLKKFARSSFARGASRLDIFYPRHITKEVYRVFRGKRGSRRRGGSGGGRGGGKKTARGEKGESANRRRQRMHAMTKALDPRFPGKIQFWAIHHPPTRGSYRSPSPSLSAPFQGPPPPAFPRRERRCRVSKEYLFAGGFTAAAFRSVIGVCVPRKIK